MKKQLAAFISICVCASVHAQTLSLPSEVDFGMLIEAEMNYQKFDKADNQSDLVVSTVELGLAAEFSDQFAGELAFLYEEDDTPFEVDVAILEYQVLRDVGLIIGQYYVPFGVFESSLISDPLTLELGEIRETALQANYVYKNMSLAAYIFNGDVNKLKNGQPSTTGKLNNYGVSLGWSWRDRTYDIFIRADYLNSIVDTDALQGDENNGFTAAGVESFESGYNLFAKLDYADFTVIGEWTAAADGIIAVESYEKIYEPSATNFEIGYHLGERTVAISYQATKEASTLGLPENRFSGVFTTPIATYFVFSTEVGVASNYGELYPGVDGNGKSDGDEETYITAKLVLEI